MAVDIFGNPINANFVVQPPQQAAAAQAPGKKKPNFLQSLLPSIGGLVGGVGGGAAGGALAGTAILPGIGTVAGGLIGAILGGSAGGEAGKFAENKSLGESAGHDVLKEGLIQGALSAGPIRLAKGAFAGGKALLAGAEAAPAIAEGATQIGGRLAQALNAGGEAAAAPGVVGRLLGKGATTVGEDGLKTSASGKIKTLVNSELANQYGTISKPIARATRPLETIEQLAKVGIVKPQEAERIAGSITGSDGILTRAVSKAVGGAERVDTNGLRQVFTDALDNNGIVDSERKSLESIFKANTTRLNGGAVGSLNPRSHPSDVLDVMKSLESKASDYLGRGGTSHLATSADKARAGVLMQVRNELEDRLYQGAGANGNVSSVLTPEVRQQLINLAPGNKQWLGHVDNNIMAATDVSALRGLQRPFVNISKIIDEGSQNALTFGGRVGNSFGSIRSQLAEKTIGAGKKQVARSLGGVVNRAGEEAAAPWGAKQVAERTLLPGLAGALAGQSMNSPMNDSAAQINNIPTSMPNINGQYASNAQESIPNLTHTPGNASPFDVSNVEKNAHNIIAHGGKLSDVAQYVSLVEALQKVKQPAGGAKLNGSQIQQANNATSGLQAIQTISNELNNNPHALAKADTPTNIGKNLTGGAKLDTARKEVADVIARLRTGAAINAQEEKLYLSKLPQFGDSPQQSAYKLQALSQLLGKFANPQPALVDINDGKLPF